MIKVKNMCKQFKKTLAVNDISFEVHEGEIVGLLGENGAGKTTTLRMLATMLKISSGTAEINGFNLADNPEKVRSQIGILFGGEVGLYDRLTARENIEYFAQLNGMNKIETKESIERLCSMLEMNDYIDKRVGKFSKGMKQKVAIARAIVHNPSVMLFDEPTSGLDVTAARIVQDFIIHCKNENKAIIFSSHTMSEVVKLCTRIIIIHKGSIIEEGTIDDIRKKHNNSDMEDIFVRLVGDKNEE